MGFVEDRQLFRHAIHEAVDFMVAAACQWVVGVRNNTWRVLQVNEASIAARSWVYPGSGASTVFAPKSWAISV